MLASFQNESGEARPHARVRGAFLALLTLLLLSLPFGQAKPCGEECDGGTLMAARASAPAPASPVDGVPFFPLVGALGLAGVGGLGVVAACRLARRAE